jgi:hypothetical protein
LLRATTAALDARARGRHTLMNEPIFSLSTR